MSSSADSSLKCSFCVKRKESVQKLISGPGVYICNECVGLCQEILDEDLYTAVPSQKVESILPSIEERQSSKLRTDLVMDALSAEKFNELQEERWMACLDELDALLEFYETYAAGRVTEPIERARLHLLTLLHGSDSIELYPCLSSLYRYYSSHNAIELAEKTLLWMMDLQEKHSLVDRKTEVLLKLDLYAFQVNLDRASDSRRTFSDIRTIVLELLAESECVVEPTE